MKLSRRQIRNILLKELKHEILNEVSPGVTVSPETQECYDNLVTALQDEGYEVNPPGSGARFAYTVVPNVIQQFNWTFIDENKPNELTQDQSEELNNAIVLLLSNLANDRGLQQCYRVDVHGPFKKTQQNDHLPEDKWFYTVSFRPKEV